MKRTAVQSLVVVAALALVLACGGREPARAPSQTTETVAPAAAEPSATGTDALTQTVDVEDSRSEEDGGTVTATAAPPPDKPVAARPSRKK